MKFILAFDKFKGSLTSEQASTCAARAVREIFSPYETPEIVVLPTADGGEGTVDAFLSACGGTRVACIVTPPHEIPQSVIRFLHSLRFCRTADALWKWHRHLVWHLFQKKNVTRCIPRPSVPVR